MRFSREDFRKAVVALRFIESNDTVWSQHWRRTRRLRTDDSDLVLEATDGEVLMEWKIPCEGEMIPLNATVAVEPLERLSKELSFEKMNLSQDENNLFFKNGGLVYPIPANFNVKSAARRDLGERLRESSFEKMPLRYALSFLNPLLKDMNRFVSFKDQLGVAGNPLTIGSAKIHQDSYLPDFSMKGGISLTLNAFLQACERNLRLEVWPKWMRISDRNQRYSILWKIVTDQFSEVPQTLETKMEFMTRRDLVLRTCSLYESESMGRIHVTGLGRSVNLESEGEKRTAVNEVPILQGEANFGRISLNRLAVKEGLKLFFEENIRWSIYPNLVKIEETSELSSRFVRSLYFRKHKASETYV